MALCKFLRGTQANYDAIATKDANGVYFCTDTGNIYLGTKAMFDGGAFKDVALKASGKVLQFTKRDGTVAELDVESIINGGVIVLTGYTKPELTAQIRATDTVNEAIGKLEKKVDDAAAGGVSAVVAGNGIAVDSTDPNRPEVSAKVKTGELALGVGEDGLTTTLKLNYDSANAKIQLLGIDDALISEFDAEAFIKDAFLNDQVIVKATATSQEITFPKSGNKHTYEGLTVGDTYLFLEFKNDGKTATYAYEKCNMTGLIPVYTAGNGLQLNGSEFSAKVVAGNGLSVDGTGIKMGKAAEDADGAMSKEDYAKVQSAVQSASGEGDDYITITAEVEDDTTNINVAAEAKIQSIDTADATHKGLASAEDVASHLSWGEF